MARLGTSPSSLKKIGKIIAERASQEDAEILPLSGRYRTSDQKAMARLLEKHIDGVASLKPEFDALMARNEAKAEAQVKKLRAQALKIARSRKPALDRMIAQRVQAFETLAHPAIPGPSVNNWVNTPIEIYSTQIELDSSSIEPSNSWAKFQLNLGKGKHLNPTVVFRFVWENSTEKYVVINATAFMALYGFCDLWCDGGVFGSSERYAWFQARLKLQLIDYTNEPFPSLGEEGVPVIDMKASSPAIWDDPDSETQYVAGDHILEKRVVPVPPRTAVGLHTTAWMYAYTGEDSGKLRADFISYGWGLIVPGVLITVLS